MSVFTEQEIAYLQEQKLGRLATVANDGAPHVVPVGFRYNAESDTVDVGGHNMGKSKKFRDARDTGKAAFVVDDVPPPWRPRGVEVRGRAEVIEEPEELIRIHPERIVGWGLDSDAYKPNSRTVG